MVFLNVYIREAHPASSQQTASDAGWKVITDKNGKKVVYHQPKTYEERRKLAETACAHWNFPIPTLVDTLEPSAGRIYQASPNRIYLIDTDGKIVYNARRGPMGANARPAEVALRKHLGLPETPLVTPERSSRGRGRR